MTTENTGTPDPSMMRLAARSEGGELRNQKEDGAVTCQTARGMRGTGRDAAGVVFVVFLVFVWNWTIVLFAFGRDFFEAANVNKRSRDT